jgi:hypothetical protein
MPTTAFRSYFRTSGKKRRSNLDTMVIMRRCFPFLLAAWAMFAQNPPAPATAPPDVDAALRERVNRFYQLEVDAKYREAEQLVAAESKDYYYDAAKPTYTSFKIESVEYSADFTNATVHMAVERIVHMPGFEGHPMRSLLPSRWKLEDGKWCWYSRPEDRRRSPFGPGPAGGFGGGTSGPPPGFSTGAQATVKLPAMPPLPPPQQMLQPHVTADRLAVQLRANIASSEQVTLTNSTPRPVTLSVADPKIPGLTFKLEPSALKPNEKAVLSIQSSGEAKASAQPIVLRVQVAQTQQVLPIRVSIAAEAQ